MVIGRPGNITHSQHPTGLCMPPGEPHRRSVFPSPKRFKDIARPGVRNVRNAHCYPPPWPMEYIPDVLEFPLTEPGTCP